MTIRTRRRITRARNRLRHGASLALDLAAFSTLAAVLAHAAFILFIR